MLAIANKHGEVQSSIPGLARIAGVSLEECEGAITKFLAPDKYSRTADDEGRRIEKVDGGWCLLNHSKYRAMASKEEAVSANAERQRRHRAKQLRNQTVTDSNAIVTPDNASVTPNRDIAEADTKAEAENTPPTGVKGGISEGNDSKNIPSTDQSKWLASLFGRRWTTAWGDKEDKA